MASRKSGAPRRYWLFKSEPDSYSWSQLLRDGRTHWNGVRNYQARNLLRDDIQIGDGVLFYHSSADPMAIVGLARVVRAGYPDASAFEPKDPYYDADSDPADPTWFQVDIEPVASFAPPLLRAVLQQQTALADMMLLQRGSRLSVQPVTAPEWRCVLALGNLQENW